MKRCTVDGLTNAAALESWRCSHDHVVGMSIDIRTPAKRHFGPRHAIPLEFSMSWCPRISRGAVTAKPRKRHLTVPRFGLSTNSPRSWTFPVHEQAAAGHFPRHFLSLIPAILFVVREGFPRRPPDILCRTYTVM